MQKKLQSKSGFTLVELIVVLVIMGILTAALVPTVTGYIGDAQDKVDASNLRMAEQAALLYLTDWEIRGMRESMISHTMSTFFRSSTMTRRVLAICPGYQLMLMIHRQSC